MAQDSVAHDTDDFNAHLRNGNKQAKKGTKIEIISMESANGNIGKSGKPGCVKDDIKYHMVPDATDSSDKSSPAVHL